jgi:hypothetical protein
VYCQSCSLILLHLSEEKTDADDLLTDKLPVQMKWGEKRKNRELTVENISYKSDFSLYPAVLIAGFELI